MESSFSFDISLKEDSAAWLGNSSGDHVWAVAWYIKLRVLFPFCGDVNVRPAKVQYESLLWIGRAPPGAIFFCRPPQTPRKKVFQGPDGDKIRGKEMLRIRFPPSIQMILQSRVHSDDTPRDTDWWAKWLTRDKGGSNLFNQSAWTICSLLHSAKANQTNILRFAATRHSLEMPDSDAAHPRLPRRHQLVPAQRHL